MYVSNMQVLHTYGSEHDLCTPGPCELIYLCRLSIFALYDEIYETFSHNTDGA
jgi:hypothetical protein